MQYDELGTPGIKQSMGFIEEAYNRELFWPSVQPLYSRMRRSDPEIATVRQVFAALARGVKIDWEMPDEPSDDDKAAQEFAQQVVEDMAGGAGDFLETLVSQVPFMGWGWWEVLPGLRDPDWHAPGEDGWQSEHSDQRIGIRRLAWRDSSSFYGWDLSETGRVRGLVQQDGMKPKVTLPLARSLHVTFGDSVNPEGLTPLEAVWRLERIKYGLEAIQGMGFEHAAGHLSVTSENTLTAQDKLDIQRTARNIMTAQEGNYAAWPKGMTGELKDTPFTAAPALLDAIRYYGILKMLTYNMQWMAISSLSGSGSYAALNDSSSMFMVGYNAMMSGFARQLDDQLGRRLFAWNAGAFPGMTRRPRLTITAIEKTISLGELASLLGPIKNTMPLGEEDFIAIRRRTGFLPETLPEIESKPEPEPEEAPAEEEPEDEQAEDEPTAEEAETAEAMAAREKHWITYLKQHPEAMNE
jgi:hypothetical protein